MDITKTFDLFPLLPAELRLKIYSCASPHRILQLGYDFPLPFLQIPHRDLANKTHISLTDSSLDPFRISLPALFHVCHESRHQCLSTYIPFAYTYAHPRNDTLYISSSAAMILPHNMNWYYNCARPPLYPLGELDRIAVEFDWLDLPPEAGETGGWLVGNNSKLLYSSPLLGGYLAAFAEFGRPQELLIVGRNGEGRLQQNFERLRGYESIKFVEEPKLYDVQKSKAVLKYIHDSWYYMTEDISWFRERLPDVRMATVERGELLHMARPDSQLFASSNQIAREWQKREYDLHGRDWNFSVDGSPYDKHHMEKAMRKARAEIYKGGERHERYFIGNA